MAIRDIFKISRKTFLNPTGWIDYDGLKAQTRTIWAMLQDAFTVPTPTIQETFEEAAKRLQLTEADIASGARRYRYYAITFFILGLIVFLYAFYLLFRYTTLTGWLLGIVTSGLLFSQAFRYDFWSLQMKRRRLGITFQEWKNSLLGGQRNIP